MLHKKVDIWNGFPYDESPEPGFRPSLETFVHTGDKVRGAVVVVPGGGYEFTSEREGEPIASQFYAAGYHAFVLWYSVSPHRHPQPIRDLSRAMVLIREQAAQWHVDPDKIAVIGFSAGGHLAASLGVHWNKPWLSGDASLPEGMNQPNALILSYPVISSGTSAHRGSFLSLLGERASAEANRMMSLEKQVGAQVPPVFLWHTVADSLVPVENSLLFAGALREAGVSFELHLFPDGGHGLSLATAETGGEASGIDPHVAGWMRLCLEWLAERLR